MQWFKPGVADMPVRWTGMGEMLLQPTGLFSVGDGSDAIRDRGLMVVSVFKQATGLTLTGVLLFALCTPARAQEAIAPIETAYDQCVMTGVSGATDAAPVPGTPVGESVSDESADTTLAGITPLGVTAGLLNATVGLVPGGVYLGYGLAGDWRQGTQGLMMQWKGAGAGALWGAAICGVLNTLFPIGSPSPSGFDPRPPLEELQLGLVVGAVLGAPIGYGVGTLAASWDTVQTASRLPKLQVQSLPAADESK